MAAVGLVLFGYSRSQENLVLWEIEVLVMNVYSTVIMELLAEQVCTMSLHVNIDKLTEISFIWHLFVCLFVF